MNKENVLKLADFIEQSEKLKFNMNSSTIPGTGADDHHCGTAGCIAGFSAVFFHSPFKVGPHGNALFDEGVEANNLGLSKFETRELFYPEDKCTWEDGEDEDENTYVVYDSITRKGAVSTLRRFAETGEIRWFWKEQV